jgi:hypothetical protein
MENNSNILFKPSGPSPVKFDQTCRLIHIMNDQELLGMILEYSQGRGHLAMDALHLAVLKSDLDGVLIALEQGCRINSWNHMVRNRLC